MPFMTKVNPIKCKTLKRSRVLRQIKTKSIAVHKVTLRNRILMFLSGKANKEKLSNIYKSICNSDLTPINLISQSNHKIHSED